VKNLALFIHHPECSEDCVNATTHVLSSDYNVRLFNEKELDADRIFYDTDVVVFPGGIGDSDSYLNFFTRRRANRIAEFIQNGGHYLGICMGAYWAGSRYFDILNDVEPEQYIKRPESDVKRSYSTVASVTWNGQQENMFFYDGCSLIGDENKMTKNDLNRWSKNATWNMHSEYTVPFVAAESPLGWQIALDWIDSKEEKIATAGWNTLSLVMSYTPDEQLDKKQIENLLKRIQKEIHGAENRIKYTMNGFVISVGTYIPSLLEKAKKTADAIGKIKVEIGVTACKIPFALDYILKIEQKGMVGKKRKTTRC
jgi:hypothetical protein